jgi:hypothetical protein
MPSFGLQQNKDKWCQGHNGVHKNILKEEILQVITENFMEMLLDMVNQNVQEALKKFQDTKNKKYKKTEDTETNKRTHGSPKYILKWNREHYK